MVLDLKYIWAGYRKATVAVFAAGIFVGLVLGSLV